MLKMTIRQLRKFIRESFGRSLFDYQAGPNGQRRPFGDSSAKGTPDPLGDKKEIDNDYYDKSDAEDIWPV